MGELLGKAIRVQLFEEKISLKNLKLLPKGGQRSLNIRFSLKVPAQFH
jgi:hypothetical protein